MKRLALSAAAAALGLTLASQASANTVTVTYDGIVNATQTIGKYTYATPDYDTADLFGGGNLEGDLMSAVVTYDTSRGVASTAPGFDDLSGSTAFDDQVARLIYRSPIDQVTFNMNGYSYSFTPDYYADVQSQAGKDGYIQESAQDLLGDNAFLTFDTVDAPSSLNYSFATANGAGGGYLLTPFNADNTSDNLQFGFFDVAVAAAPEPSTWALMLLGVGLCGWSLRRRPRAQMIRIEA